MYDYVLAAKRVLLKYLTRMHLYLMDFQIHAERNVNRWIDHIKAKIHCMINHI